MIFNYLKIAYRNLLKYKFISFINLFGLTVGLACCLMILTYIVHEVSYDRHHPNAENTYRVHRTWFNSQTGAVSLTLGSVAPPIGPLLKEDFKEVQNTTRLLQSNLSMSYNDNRFREEAYWGDEQFFSFFKVSMIKGNPANALADPYSIVLTPEVARKYFGDEDPMNKVLRLNNRFPFRVTGVIEPFPLNSHFHPDFIISFNSLRDTLLYGEENLRTNWGNNSFFTFVRLPDNYDPAMLEAKLPAFLDRNVPNSNASFKPSSGTALTLHKLTDIHLHSHTDFEAEENGDIRRVYIFSAIALFIMLIACINYMNLSTARSALRAREIGVRKVVGARRKEIILQFLAESVMITIVAMILALGLTFILLPYLNHMAGVQLTFDMLMDPKLILGITALPIVVGLLSGLYPALFMSSFNPSKVLKGLFKVGGANVSFRQVLVTAQFAVSIVLIICTVVALRQLRYMQTKSLGFDKEHIVTMPYNIGLNESYDAFRNELLSNPSIRNAGRSSRIPTGRLLDASGAMVDGGDSLVPSNADIKVVSVDAEFIPTYGIGVMRGRNFREGEARDTMAFALNESALKVLNLDPEQALGKRFRYGSREGTISGIVRDFHFESLHQPILPMVMMLPRSDNGYANISVKVSGRNIEASLQHIETTWKKFLPEAPYQYTFLDENFERLYQAEQRQSNIFSSFAGIAIIIASLGLFGLSAFTISQRVKEIGIRKVLGASVSSIVKMLSYDFLKLVILAALIAFPLAWYGMHNWLQDFAYRISMPWWAFVLAGIIAAIIAFVTISFQAVKAALSNPVTNLRTE